MKTEIRISETEWEIMTIVWKRHPITANEILDHLATRDSTWHPKTARTLLGRLVRKGALGYKPHGRSYAYRPKVTEAECVAQMSESFIDRFFGGSLKPMLSHFVQRQKLSHQEIQELKNILDGKEGDL